VFDLHEDLDAPACTARALAVLAQNAPTHPPAAAPAAGSTDLVALTVPAALAEEPAAAAPESPGGSGLNAARAIRTTGGGD
jgi:hypothetical protein